jgi:magnesium transporter
MTTLAVEFDFVTKHSQTIELEATSDACSRGLSCWLDVDTAATDPARVKPVLEKLGINSQAIEQALGPDQEGRHDVHADCVHVAATAVRVADGRLQTVHVDIIVAQQFIVTLHRGPVDFIELIRRTYRQDFEKFAKTLSFILYELFDHLIDGYRRASRALEVQVEQLQERIYDENEREDPFADAGRITRSLLTFRAVLLAARDVLHELSTRRSIYVSESCQPYLANLTGTLERLAQDVAVEREVLAELVSISMGMVAQRTNHVVNRLTALSIIFLPLSFLAGVYGMNFKEGSMPELMWDHGYQMFWVLALVITLALVTVMRRKNWL